MTDNAAELIKYANQCEASAAELEARYGTGIRPAWVGDEVSILHARAATARAKAAGEINKGGRDA